MKNTFLLFMLLSVLISCEKEDDKLDNIQFVGTVPGGCAVAESNPVRTTYIGEDTVTYTITDGNLDLLVGFESSCCEAYSTSSTLNNDTIIINVNKKPNSLNCDCYCYYSYNFKYTGVNKARNYKVNVNNNLAFSGIINP